MVTKEGVRVDPEKVQAIIRSLVPKNVSQIRSLFLQLAAIDKFVPKLAKLKHPIRKVRMKLEAEEGSGWAGEAEEAFLKRKRKLSKPQALTLPKDGKVLMLCLRPKDETISSLLLV
ncbi:hypothetical protein Tco_1085539 [Tanacetum coccineum]